MAKGCLSYMIGKPSPKNELNVDTFLLQANEIKQLPCKLEATQVISIQVNPEKEILLLPKFAI